jgi:hypothetical protein
LKKWLAAGSLAGLTMGIALFVGGAILARIIYGPRMAPPGKFSSGQMNAFYFIWTKLAIGWFFGLLFTLAYEMLPLRKRISGIGPGLASAFAFWLVIGLWNLSHPLVYGSLKVRDQVFWLLYQLVGFLAFGAMLGHIYRRRERDGS